MDRMTPMAVGGALVAIFFSMIVDGSSPTLLFKPAPIILVFGGTALAAAAGFMKSDVKKVKDVLKTAMGAVGGEPRRGHRQAGQPGRDWPGATACWPWTRRPRGSRTRSSSGAWR